ncbi:MliC family protein [Deinococcus sp. MIMF12]|uniref:MliC family protein n=1 Tax=Deinococcus rhizophilus TaxID=3049544 RepID=A0ABT7JDQ0_9DEIO|nr:MliC family protein [Deinococcus rhizophilus]
MTSLRSGEEGARFAVLRWRGQEHRLAQAISASGARYAGLSGPETDTGRARGLLTGCRSGR